jgi:hypothetical protein
MPDRKRRLSATQAEGEEQQKPAKKPTPLGTDSATTVPTPEGNSLELTFWDFWFALVAAKEYGGDLSGLGNHLCGQMSIAYISRESVERKQSHLLELRKRLVDADLTVDDILAAAGDLIRTEQRRAFKRVLEHTEREREWSEAMRETPRKRRSEHALRGSWARFPVSPEPYAAKIWSRFKTEGFYSKRASFGLEKRLDRFLEQANKLLESGQYAKGQALLRAWLTVVIELLGMADDSYGCIGDCFQRGFATYLNISLDRTGIAEEVFFTDLLNLLIWEDYGLTYNQTHGYFKALRTSQSDMCIEHLRQQIDDLSADCLAYQSEQALTLLGQVVAEAERFELFESLARRMGAREWERIIWLTDKAVKRHKPLLARQVFEAALTTGPHLDLLKKKHEQLKMGRWMPDPRE